MTIVVQLLFLACFAGAISSCMYQHVHVGEVLQAHKKQKLTPLFIEMPRNNKIFEHLSPIMYETVVHHFESVGYRLVTNNKDGFRLSIEVADFFPERKFVSPDVLLFHATMSLKCVCVLYDFADRIVCREVFSFSKLFSKPRNPVMAGSFFDYELKILLQRSMHKIEQKFRPFLLENKSL